MFTGLVEEVGVVISLPPAGRAGAIGIRARTVLGGTRIGDSIAVNGTCLTVVELGADRFGADVMPATLAHTSLGALRPGDRVNLERAMPADGRFGGHIVTGHVDGVGTVFDVRADQNAVRLTIAAPPEIMSLVIDRGSIAVDGVSLTVADRARDRFTVSIIPHTGQETTLAGKRPGATVNLENDVVGKYVRALVGGAAGIGAGTDVAFAGSSPPGGPPAREPEPLTRDFLARHGF